MQSLIQGRAGLTLVRSLLCATATYRIQQPSARVPMCPERASVHNLSSHECPHELRSGTRELKSLPLDLVLTGFLVYARKAFPVCLSWFIHLGDLCFCGVGGCSFSAPRSLVSVSDINLVPFLECVIVHFCIVLLGTIGHLCQNLSCSLRLSRSSQVSTFCL